MNAVDILLITPPFIQPNTCYPATPFLKGFLTQEGFHAKQVDLSLETILQIFSEKGVTEIFDLVAAKCKSLPPHHIKMLKRKDQYCALIEPVIKFLQGNHPLFETMIIGGILPKGNRYKLSADSMDLLDPNDTNSKAKFLATLFIEDIADLITEHVDSHFGFSRYAEQIGYSPHDFKLVEQKIISDTYITKQMCRLFDEAIQTYQPKVIAFTIPFPGNLLSVLKIAQHSKQKYPELPIIIGGGWVNTELRQLNEPRLFDYVDYVCLDFGERPLLQLLNHLLNNHSKEKLCRTFLRVQDNVCFVNDASLEDIHPAKTGIPDYSDLLLDKYISVIEMANPMHNLWSNGRWNKLMVAQGCYWHACAFCDTSLDYIAKYKAIPATVIADRIEAMIRQTGYNGFHFVDEAAPPKALKELALEIIKRKLAITWWANIRFEKQFDAELCKLLAQSGCIAVSGGLEVLSDRLLLKMNKGVTIEQAVNVTNHFQQAGIMVHAYLMYGFPSQTEQETIDALEVVRQLFKQKLIQSAFFHRFVMTAHSPIGKAPEQFNVSIKNKKTSSFANNDLRHEDPTGCKHELYSACLKKALYNFMHGNCLDVPVHQWFDVKVLRTALSDDFVLKIRG